MGPFFNPCSKHSPTSPPLSFSSSSSSRTSPSLNLQSDRKKLTTAHKRIRKKLTHNGVVLRGHNIQKFSVMRRGQQAKIKKDVATIMDHLGVDEKTIGPQKC